MPFKTTSADEARSKYELPSQSVGPPDLKVKQKLPKQESALEADFAFHWKLLFPDLELVPEHRFHEVRKYRLDFAHIKAKVGIELQGGIWQKGGHSSGKGITRDCEKQWTALTGGWIVFPLTDEMSRNHETLEGIAQVIRQRLEVKP